MNRPQHTASTAPKSWLILSASGCGSWGGVSRARAPSASYRGRSYSARRLDGLGQLKAPRQPIRQCPAPVAHPWHWDGPVPAWECRGRRQSTRSLEQYGHLWRVPKVAFAINEGRACYTSASSPGTNPLLGHQDDLLKVDACTRSASPFLSSSLWRPLKRAA